MRLQKKNEKYVRLKADFISFDILLFLPHFYSSCDVNCCRNPHLKMNKNYLINNPHVGILNVLKRHNQAKFIKQSVILFWLLNMTI